ncbi:MAG: NAD(+)/NADH kinase [Candidatus Hodarchaeota archaeon]
MLSLGIVAKPGSTRVPSIVKSIIECARGKDVKIIASEGVPEDLPVDERCPDISEMDADYVICLGGDGTILRAIKRLKDPTIPILGVNLGVIGFLAEIEPEEIKEKIPLLLEGKFEVEECIRVASEFEGKRLTDALNEVVIKSAQPAKVVHTEVKINGEVVGSGTSDGLIIATPTGSTAYALSAGGPVIDPRLEALVLVLICPMGTGLKPLVVPTKTRDGSTPVEIQISVKKSRNVVLVLDGQWYESFEVEPSSLFKFRVSENSAYFVRFKRDYYNRVKRRLSV